MVGFDSDSKDKLSTFQTALAGGTAGAVTRAICQPLDVLKIRFQLQTEPIRQTSKYTSLIQATRTVIKEEGIKALWSGHIPAQLLSISYGFIEFSSFEVLTAEIHHRQPGIFQDYSHYVNFTCGALASSSATILTYPLDTVRTRLIAETKISPVYKGVRHTFVKIIATEGVLSLYKGLLTTVIQIVPRSGIQFTVYKFLTDNFLNQFSIFKRNSNLANKTELTVVANFMAGSAAGLVSKIAVYPLDLVKKRLQIQGFQEHRKFFGKQMYCKGFIDCVRITIKVEGVIGLYKGLGAGLYKAMLVVALQFSVYDEVKNFLLNS